jgi:dCMP deaminase
MSADETFSFAAAFARAKRWEISFLVDALVQSRRSKDPSTKVGAVIVREDRTTVSNGYNGFPRGVKDSDERLNDRSVKYEMVVHGEANAILTAREPLHGYTIYTVPFPPCSRCAGMIIQAGIKRVVAIKPSPEIEERWADSLALSRSMFREAAVTMTEYPMDEVLEQAFAEGVVFRAPILKADQSVICSCQ